MLKQQSTAALLYVAVVVFLCVLMFTSGALIGFTILFFLAVIGIVTAERVSPYIRWFSRAFFQSD